MNIDTRIRATIAGLATVTALVDWQVPLDTRMRWAVWVLEARSPLPHPDPRNEALALPVFGF